MSLFLKHAKGLNFAQISNRGQCDISDWPRFKRLFAYGSVDVFCNEKHGLPLAQMPGQSVLFVGLWSVQNRRVSERFCILVCRRQRVIF